MKVMITMKNLYLKITKYLKCLHKAFLEYWGSIVNYTKLATLPLLVPQFTSCNVKRRQKKSLIDNNAYSSILIRFDSKNSRKITIYFSEVVLTRHPLIFFLK